MSYYNIYTLENKSSLSLMNDAQVLWNYSLYGNGGQPSKIEKEYSNFYEFILTNGEKKLLILEDVITSSMIDQLTSNNKSLLKKAYISNNSYPLITNEIGAQIDIDYEEDLQLAELIITRKK